MADSGLFNMIYNPDVLTCLANLSNDEVFTPPDVANQMLDLLPQELFRNPDTRFLDPACKSGVFLREIAKRLLTGLERQIPDLQERVDHIFHNQLYGISITELTSLLSRRSVYCSKYANSRYSVTSFSTPDGNIRYKQIQHTWKNGKCVYCGASQSEYDRSEDLETHAYEFIHWLQPEEIFGMKFDVIIGNPPYQLSDGGNAASALPIYQKFVQQAKKLNPRFLTMVIPARWFMGGRGLDTFRDEMLHDDRIRVIHDFLNASDCFPGVEIKGGICYFLWNRDARGLCDVYSHNGNDVVSSTRALLEPDMDTFIRSDVQISVLQKVRAVDNSTLSDWLNAGRFFGFHTRIDWDGQKTAGTIQTADGKSFIPMKASRDNSYTVKVYIHGGECWVKPQAIPKNREFVKEYKVLIPRSGNPGSSIIGKPKVSEPESCSSNTYVVAVPPTGGLTKKQAENIISYLKTKFVRFLVSIKTSTQDMPPKAYAFVPLQDFDKRWTDDELFKKYGLNAHEINGIIEAIPEMD